MIILDGNRHFGMSLERYRRTVMIPKAQRLGVTVPPLDQVADAEPVPALVNHNRWGVVCPDCGGACFVWLDAPLMLCECCWNGAVGYLWRRVELPEEAIEIERVLRERRLPHNRNWRPDETVADLEDENVCFGAGGRGEANQAAAAGGLWPTGLREIGRGKERS